MEVSGMGERSGAHYATPVCTPSKPTRSPKLMLGNVQQKVKLFQLLDLLRQSCWCMLQALENQVSPIEQH